MTVLRALVLLGYAALLALLIMSVTGSTQQVLPLTLASPVSRNSEGLLLVLFLGPWIQWVRPRLGRARLCWPTTTAVSVGFVLVAMSLLIDGVPPSLRTLNESCFALAVLVPYVQLCRPIALWAWALPAVAVVVPVAAAHSSAAVTLAETFAFLLLVPLSLDLADRSILEAGRGWHPRVTITWLLLFVTIPVFLHVVRPDRPQNLLDEVLRYLSRTTEAYLAAVLLLGLLSLLPGLAGKLGGRTR